MNRNMPMRSTVKVIHNQSYLYKFAHLMDYLGYIRHTIAKFAHLMDYLGYIRHTIATGILESS